MKREFLFDSLTGEYLSEKKFLLLPQNTPNERGHNLRWLEARVKSQYSDYKTWRDFYCEKGTNLAQLIRTPSPAELIAFFDERHLVHRGLVRKLLYDIVQASKKEPPERVTYSLLKEIFPQQEEFLKHMVDVDGTILERFPR